jgi:hypothetical protein
MRFRKLRIALSVACSITCLLLIASWVRSYRVIDVVQRTTSTRITLVSETGIIQLSRLRPAVESPTLQWHTLNDFMGTHPRTWSFNSSRDGIRISFPHRLPIAMLATVSIFAGKPWIDLRFSLRTLLVATMLVAVVLGLVFI